MRSVEHIGIAVENLAASIELFTQLLGQSPYKTETVEREGVETVFFQLGETKIELLGATNDESPIAKFIGKRGPGIHHIAINVQDIEAEIQRLSNQGFEFVSTTPKPGADNKLICFLHPKGTNGVLIELCQELP
jgi:methylmalonyl-CoA/ethylmalonyl-CoA epimerase